MEPEAGPEQPEGLDETRRFRCTVCLETFATRPQLGNHSFAVHDSFQPFVCGAPDCLEIFANQAEVNQHRIAIPDHDCFPTALFCCRPECDTICENPSELWKHECGHHSITCDVVTCDRNFHVTRLQNLLQHRARAHTALFSCSLEGCTASFDEEMELVLHQTRHNEPKPYLCNQKGCSDAFASLLDLLQHEILHGRIPCDICEVTYSAENLPSHMRYKHELKWKCGSCLRTTSAAKADNRQDSLRRHLEQHALTLHDVCRIERSSDRANFNIIFEATNDIGRHALRLSQTKLSLSRPASLAMAATLPPASLTWPPARSKQTVVRRKSKPIQMALARQSTQSKDGQTPEPLPDIGIGALKLVRKLLQQRQIREEQNSPYPIYEHTVNNHLLRLKHILLSSYSKHFAFERCPLWLFASDRPRRELKVSLTESISEDSTTRLQGIEVVEVVTGPNIGQRRVFDVSGLKFATGHMTLLCNTLQRILQGLPFSPWELPTALYTQILQEALVFVQARDATVSIAYHRPRRLVIKDTILFAVAIRGYDPSSGEWWEAWDYVEPHQKSRALEDGSADWKEWLKQYASAGITWVPKGDDDPIPEELKSRYTDDELRQAYEFAQLITIRYSSWIGSRDFCVSHWSEPRRYADAFESKTLSLEAHQMIPRLSTGRVRDSSALSYRREIAAGGSLIKIISLKPGIKLIRTAITRETPFVDGRELDLRSSLFAGDTLSIALEIGDIEGVHSVVDVFYTAIFNGYGFGEAWAQLCQAADEEELKAKEGSSHGPIRVCTGCVHRIHVCPGCWKLRACQSFFIAAEDQFPLCSSCHKVDEPKLLPDELPPKNSTPGKPPSKKLPGKNPQPRGPPKTLMIYLLRNLRRSLRAEAKVANFCTLNWIQSQEAEIKVELSPYMADDQTALDGLIDQPLPHNIEGKLTWCGARRHPKRASIDAYLPVVRGPDGKTRYHQVGNIGITSDSINRAMRHHPKFLLRAIRQMSFASTEAERRGGLGLFQNHLRNRAEMPALAKDNRLVKRTNRPIPDNFETLLEALTYGTLLPQTKSNKAIWKFTFGGRVTYKTIVHLNTRYQYFEAQLERTAVLYGLQNEPHRSFWLRDGVFFPFSIDAITPPWTKEACYIFFCSKMDRLLKYCDRIYEDQGARDRLVVEELMLSIAHLHMSNCRRDLDRGFPLTNCGQDEAGMIPHPTVGWQLSSSVGHQHHGKQMFTGISGWDLSLQTDCEWDRDKCNICWETQFCNELKYDYNEDHYDELFEQLSKVRLTPIPNAPVGIPETIADGNFLTQQDVSFESNDGSDIDSEPDDEEDLAAVEADADIMDVLSGTTRCPCGRDANDEDTSSLMVECQQCSTWQHLQCMGLGGEDDEGEYLCERCAPERFPQLAIVFTNDQQTLLQQPSQSQEAATTLPVPISAEQGTFIELANRNLDRLDMTCYISAPVQVLLRLHEMQKALTTSPSILITGRDPRLLANVDSTPGMAKLELLFSCLRNIARSLTFPGTKLTKDLTSDLLAASGALDKTWQDLPEDASSYYEFLLNMINLTSDRSSYDNITGNSTALQLWEKKALQKQRTEGSLNLLRTDVDEYLQAFRQSGHTDCVSEHHTVHIVKEFECTICRTITRKFQDDVKLLVQVPKGLRPDQSFSLKDTRQSFFKVALEEGSCSRCDELGNERLSPDEQWIRKEARVVHAPELLAFEIGRVENITQPGSKDYTTSDLANRLVDANEFDLKDWATPGNLPSLDAHDGSAVGIPSTKYKRIAVLAHVGGWFHWVANIRQGASNNGDWMLYDDKDEAPFPLSPDLIDHTHGRFKGYCEGLVLYRKIAEDPQQMTTPAVLEDQPPAQSTGAPAATNDSHVTPPSPTVSDITFSTTGSPGLTDALGKQPKELVYGEDEGMIFGGEAEKAADAPAGPSSDPIPQQIPSAEVSELNDKVRYLEAELAKMNRTLKEKDAALNEANNNAVQNRDLIRRARAIHKSTDISLDASEDTFKDSLYCLEYYIKWWQNLIEIAIAAGVDWEGTGSKFDEDLAAFRAKIDKPRPFSAAQHVDRAIANTDSIERLEMLKKLLEKLSRQDNPERTFDAFFLFFVRPLLTDHVNPTEMADMIYNHIVRPLLSDNQSSRPRDPRSDDQTPHETTHVSESGIRDPNVSGNVTAKSATAPPKRPNVQARIRDASKRLSDGMTRTLSGIFNPSTPQRREEKRISYQDPEASRSTRKNTTSKVRHLTQSSTFAGESVSSSKRARTLGYQPEQEFSSGEDSPSNRAGRRAALRRPHSSGSRAEADTLRSKHPQNIQTSQELPRLSLGAVSTFSLRSALKSSNPQRAADTLPKKSASFVVDDQAEQDPTTPKANPAIYSRPPSTPTHTQYGGTTGIDPSRSSGDDFSRFLAESRIKKSRPMKLSSRPSLTSLFSPTKASAAKSKPPIPHSPSKASLGGASILSGMPAAPSSLAVRKTRDEKQGSSRKLDPPRVVSRGWDKIAGFGRGLKGKVGGSRSKSERQSLRRPEQEPEMGGTGDVEDVVEDVGEHDKKFGDDHDDNGASGDDESMRDV